MSKLHVEVRVELTTLLKILQMSATILFTPESIKEIDNLLNDKKFYIDTDGSLAYSTNDDILKFTIKHMVKASNINKEG